MHFFLAEPTGRHVQQEVNLRAKKKKILIRKVRKLDSRLDRLPMPAQAPAANRHLRLVLKTALPSTGPMSPGVAREGPVLQHYRSWKSVMGVVTTPAHSCWVVHWPSELK